MKGRETYRVAGLAGPVIVDGQWDKEPWSGIRPAVIARPMGEKPAHFPRTQAKIAYDDEALYVVFRVEDRFVRAAARRNQDPVCQDSCVEFFFTPGTDLSVGYFNIEVNCGGTVLFHFQEVPRGPFVAIPEKELGRVAVAHTMPGIVDPEIPDPTTWTVEVRVPIDLLEEYCPVPRPAPGVLWRANLYKCADLTSHPHWLTWSLVDRPHPDFHVPEHFGVLEFE